ncbi:MAG: hypothetical protein PHN69_00090 [Candidatus Pacebacteria bacterium]|nr:hypothetical protein [Candidatus Paceibacterota bacterium]
MNVEMERKFRWIDLLNWKNIVMVLFGVLLIFALLKRRSRT